MTPARAQEMPAALKGSVSIPAVLLAYQREVLKATAAYPVTVCEKSRRIGVTWAIAADAVLTAGAARVSGGMDAMYIGYNLDMAREFVDTCAMWGKAFAKAVGKVGAVEEFLFEDRLGDDTRSIQAYRVSFASGFDIVALASRPRSLRGRQGYVIVDEAAFHDQLKELLKAAYALLIWGGKVLVISTHDGADNAFAELVEDVRAGRQRAKLLRITFDEALADGLYRRVCLTTGKPWSPEAQTAWRAEIRAVYGDGAAEELDVIPSQGSGVFLSRAMIEARMVAGPPVLRWSQPDSFAELDDATRKAACDDWLEAHVKPLLAALDPLSRHVLGQDFARHVDLSVIWPLAIGADLVRRTPFVIELRNIPFRQQEQILFYVGDGLPRFSKGVLDAGGNGAALAEFGAQRYGARIEQLMLSVAWYRERMPRFKAAFVDATILLPRDADILGDLRSIVLDKGVAKIGDSRTVGADGGARHGDAAIAGALAWYASELDWPESDADAVGTERAAAGGWGMGGSVVTDEDEDMLVDADDSGWRTTAGISGWTL